MSGWGESPGTSYYALAVRDKREAQVVARNFRARADFKNTRFVRQLPTIGARDHMTIADWTIAKFYYRAARGAQSNPALSPSAAKARYKRDHWGNPGAGVVRRMTAPNPNAGTLVELGELIEVVYRTKKGGDAQHVDYEHAFKKARPILAYNDTGLVIVSGDYSVTVRGIVG